MQSVHITTNVVSSNPAHGEVYSIQYYVINIVSDLRRNPVFPTNKIEWPDFIWKTVENGVKHHNPNPPKSIDCLNIQDTYFIKVSPIDLEHVNTNTTQI